MKKVYLLTTMMLFALSLASAQICDYSNCYGGRTFFWTIAFVLLVILLVWLVVWLTNRQVDRDVEEFEESHKELVVVKPVDPYEVKFEINDKNKTNLRR